MKFRAGQNISVWSQTETRSKMQLIPTSQSELPLIQIRGKMPLFIQKAKSHLLNSGTFECVTTSRGVSSTMGPTY